MAVERRAETLRRARCTVRHQCVASASNSICWDAGRRQRGAPPKRDPPKSAKWCRVSLYSDQGLTKALWSYQGQDVISLQQRITNWSPTILRFGDYEPGSCPRESQLIAKHSPAGLRDSDARDFDHTSAENHALAMRGCKPVTDEIDHLPRREAMRPHHRLGAAVAARRTQFERAVAGWRIWTALWMHGFASHRGRIAEQDAGSRIGVGE